MPAPAFSTVKIRLTSLHALQGRIYEHYNSPNDFLIEVTGEDLQVEVTRSRALNPQGIPVAGSVERKVTI